MARFRIRNLAHSLNLAVRVLLIISFLCSSVQVALAAPNHPPPSTLPNLETSYKERLGAGEKLTVTADGCKLAVTSNTGVKVIIKCRDTAQTPKTAPPQSALTLKKGDKVKVLGNGCSILVLKTKPKKIKLGCSDSPESTDTPTPSRTFTRTEATTKTPTRTSTGTATKTFTPSATRTRTYTPSATRTFTRTLTPTATNTPPNSAPTIQLTSPSGGGSTANSIYQVTWTDSDPDDNASISLYLDNTNSGTDGVLLANNLKEDDNGGGGAYQLDVSTLEPGSYYLYALIEDDGNTPAISYSPGKLTISNNAPSGTIAGSTAGNFDVNFLGAATYSIPISLSPGTGGMAPELALGYNSQSGNGLVGMGWSLSGLSVISRCPATWAQDNLNDGVDFDTLDKFCLDGERLVAVSGNYGSDGTKYRLEHEQFSDITSSSPPNAPPTAFTVRTKAGLTMHYTGMNAAGRNVALFWVVDRVSDTSGNYFTVTYNTSNAANGEYFPERIDYTGNTNTNLAPYNRVEFFYEGRQDVTQQYVAGSQVLTAKRLAKIRTLANSVLVREYRLAYVYGTVSNRSHLSSVTECASDTVCFSPTTFGWDALAQKWGDLLQLTPSFWAPGSGTWTGHMGSNYFQGDFNGDGKHDLMVGTGNAQWKLHLSTGVGFDATSGTTADGRWYGGVTYQNNVVGDFNGDGRDDVMGFKEGTTNTWRVGLSAGNNFNKSGSGDWANGPVINSNSSPSQVSQVFRAGDFNGDGKDDLIKPQDPANPTYQQGMWRIVFSNGTSFGSGAAWKADGTTDTSNIFIGNFTGDSKDDLLTYRGSGNWQVYQTTSSGFTKLGSTWAGHSGGQGDNVVADFNGDGLDDIAGFTGNPQQQWHVCLSTGSGFNCAMWLSGTPSNMQTGGILNPSAAAGDFNGDGKADIATQNQVGVKDWVVSLSGDIYTGTFSGPGSGFWGGHIGGFERNLTGDFDGDGKMDLAGNTPNSYLWHVSRSTGTEFVDYAHQWSGANVMPNQELSNVRAGDFNGDGRTDIATANGGTWNLAISNGSNFTNYSTGGPVAGPGGTMANIVTGDFNGDGKTDVAGDDSANYGWHIYFANAAGTGLDESSFWQQGPVATVPETIGGDFNGDGKTDLAAYTGSENNWHVALSSGTEFNDQGSGTSWQGPSEGIANTISGDFNGDGKTDLASHTSASGKWHVYLSTGIGFMDAGLWAGHAGGAQNNIVGDFNGDGLTDIAGFSPERQEWNVALSTGTSFSGVGTGFWKGVASDASKTVVADFNGDGKSDLAGFSPTQHEWHVTMPGGFTPDLMSKVTTGTGKTISVIYNPLSNSNIHTQDHDATYPRFDFAGSLYVVSRFTQTNGIGGTNEYIYRYAGAETNLRGRGFRGFRVLQVTDPQSKITTTTYFDQNHLYPGIPLKVVKQQQVTGALISVLTNTLNFKDYGNGTYFSFIAHSQDETFEINNSCKLNPDNSYTCSPVTTVITEFVYNATDILFGNVSQVITRTTGSHITTTTNTYTNDTAKWILGRLTKSDIKQSMPNTPDILRTSTFEYDPNTGLLKKETSDPSKSVQLSKTYGRDLYGNITTSTVSSPGLPDRTTTSGYDAQGRFATTTKNALNHTVSATFEPRLGNAISSKSLNNLTTNFTYDEFGRKQTTTRPDGTITRSYYLKCAGNCPANAVYKVEERSTGAASVIAYMDMLDRVIQSETRNFNGQRILVDTVYDNQGRRIKVSEPYVSGSAPLWHTFDYDDAGRQTKETFPDGTSQSVQYNGLTTVVTNRNLQNLTKTVNGKGWLVQSKDHLGHPMTYTYDAVGNNLKTTDPLGNTTTIVYDLANRQTQITDPNTGTTKSEYNAYGELVSQTNNKQEKTTFTYDNLGRTLTRTSPEGAITWTYDTATMGIGKLAAVSQPWSNYSEAYTYDSLGRLARTSQVIDGTMFNTDTGYDFWGRPSLMTYPSGLKVRSFSHVTGSLASVRNGANNKLFWELRSVTQRGQVAVEKFGDTSLGTRTYDAPTGFLKNISTVGKYATVQALAFNFDAVGNLKLRSDSGLSLTETFSYDSLNRLTQSQLNGVTNLTVSYDDIGNIKYKSDVGTYTYGGVNAGPHQVKSITGAIPNNYTYDANGNRIASNKETIAYTSFNQPRTMTAGTATASFTYGPTLNRVKQVSTINAVTTTTYYLGAAERRLSPNGTTTLTEDLHYVMGPSGPIVAISIKSQNGATLTKNSFLHLDHLGSIDTITDDSGNIQQKSSFDAWGRQRDPQTWKPSPLGSAISAKKLEKLARKAEHRATAAPQESKVPGAKKTARAATAAALTPTKIAGAKKTARAATAAATSGKVRGAKKTARAATAAALTPTKIAGAKKTARALTRIPNFATPLPKKVRNNKQAQLLVAKPILNRGFTGHEHLEAFDLINMNGRVYDPIIGRFLSADPIVQQPDFTQSYNRYSYVLNNPLSYTDPTGFSIWGEFTDFVGDFVEGIGKVLSNPKSLIAIGVGILTAGTALWALGPTLGLTGSVTFSSTLSAIGGGAGLGAAVVSGAGFGFGSAFAGTLLAGGSIRDALRAGLSSSAIAGGTAFAMGQVGSWSIVKESKVIKSISHGVIAGAVSELGGGSFQSGFKNSIFQDLMRGAYDYMYDKTNELALKSDAHRGIPPSQHIDPLTGELRTDGTTGVEGVLSGKSESIAGSLGITMSDQTTPWEHWYEDWEFGGYATRRFINAVSKTHDFFNSWGYNWTTGNYVSKGMILDSLFDVYSFSGMLPAAAFTGIALMPKPILSYVTARQH